MINSEQTRSNDPRTTRALASEPIFRSLPFFEGHNLLCSLLCAPRVQKILRAIAGPTKPTQIGRFCLVSLMMIKAEICKWKCHCPFWNRNLTKYSVPPLYWDLGTPMLWWILGPWTNPVFKWRCIMLQENSPELDLVSAIPQSRSISRRLMHVARHELQLLFRW